MVKFDVLTALDVCIDFLALGCPVPRFNQTEQLIDDYALELGGSATIFSSQCAKLGLDTLAVGRVGKDFFGEMFAEKLAETGVDVSGLLADENAKTGVGIALCQARDRAILTYAGTIDGTSPDMIEENLPKCRHLHIASYYLMKNLQPHWPDLLKTAKAHKLSVSLDTNWDPDEWWTGINELQGYVDVIMPNENEAKAFTGEKDLDKAALQLAKRFPYAVIKLGADGAMACHQGKLVRMPGLDDVPVDTVGAGDTFDAGFIYGWLQNLDLETCLAIGCFCGSKSTTASGGITAQPHLAALTAYLASR